MPHSQLVFVLLWLNVASLADTPSAAILTRIIATQSLGVLAYIVTPGPSWPWGAVCQWLGKALTQSMLHIQAELSHAVAWKWEHGGVGVSYTLCCTCMQSWQASRQAPYVSPYSDSRVHWIFLAVNPQAVILCTGGSKASAMSSDISKRTASS